MYFFNTFLVLYAIYKHLIILLAFKRGEWPSGPASSINWMGDLPDERRKQLTQPSFGRDIKLGVPCLDVACIVGLN